MILIHKNKSFFFKDLNNNFDLNVRKNFKCILLSQTKIFLKKKKYHKNKIKTNLTKILNRRSFLHSRKIKKDFLKNKKNFLIKSKKRKTRFCKFFFFYLRRNKMKSSPRTLISKFKNFFIRCVYKKKRSFFFNF